MTRQRIKRWLALLVIHIFNYFPIKKNKVILFSYYGSQYGCNPKYITEDLLKHTEEDRFDIVWAVHDRASKQLPDQVRQVKMMSLRYFYELCTAKIIITNYRMTDLFVKRNSQYYIQTWHSSLRLKQIEKDAEDALPASYVQMAKRDSEMCDLLLSGSHDSTKIFERSFWYEGEIFEHGTPRNDLFFQKNHDQKGEVFVKLNIPSRYNILLYAPTFRKDNQLDVYDLDYQRLIETATKKFGGEWMVLVKLHPHLIAKSSELVYGDKVIDVTSYDDIQELLLIADILISDYSSLIFDYLFTKRPCFLYVPDMEEYTRSDRKLYFDLQELPFLSASTNQGLYEKIIDFKEDTYQKGLEDFLDRIGSYEEGVANSYVRKRIEDVCYPPNK